jgi:hypothetical protein
LALTIELDLIAAVVEPVGRGDNPPRREAPRLAYKAMESEIDAMKSFADGLQDDMAAVEAARVYNGAIVW